MKIFDDNIPLKFPVILYRYDLEDKRGEEEPNFYSHDLLVEIRQMATKAKTLVCPLIEKKNTLNNFDSFLYLCINKLANCLHIREVKKRFKINMAKPFQFMDALRYLINEENLLSKSPFEEADFLKGDFLCKELEVFILRSFTVCSKTHQFSLFYTLQDRYFSLFPTSYPIDETTYPISLQSSSIEISFKNDHLKSYFNPSKTPICATDELITYSSPDDFGQCFDLKNKYSELYNQLADLYKALHLGPRDKRGDRKIKKGDSKATDENLKKIKLSKETLNDREEVRHYDSAKVSLCFFINFFVFLILFLVEDLATKNFHHKGELSLLIIATILLFMIAINIFIFKGKLLLKEEENCEHLSQQYH